MKIVRENLFEVSRNEDEWANQEIAKHIDRYKYEKEPVKTPVSHFTTDEYTQAKDILEKKRYVDSIKNLGEFIWENAPMDKKLEWDDYLDSFSSNGLGEMIKLEDLKLEQLEDIYIKGRNIVNNMKQTGNDLD